MFAKLKSKGALISLIGVIIVPMTGTASAIDAAVAKKCSTLMTKAFPPRKIGNPAAGSAKGTGKAQRDYFKNCVASGGNMDENPSKEKSNDDTNKNAIPAPK